jgi:signal transduction histidine kinase
MNMFRLTNFTPIFNKFRLEQRTPRALPTASAPLTAVAQPSASHRTYAEVGLLPAFRMVIGLELLLSLLGTIVIVAIRRNSIPLAVTVSILGLLLLFGYLCSERLERWLGPAYLPLGLIAGTLLPLVDRLLFIRLWIEQNQLPVSEQMLSGAGWRVLALMLIPLVFTAWQYDFPRVLLFAICVLVTDFALLFGFFGFHSELRVQIVGMVVGQSLIFIVVGYMISRLMYAQREQRRIVDEANQQLTHYAATIEQLATSRERNRLARELHDTLAHSLSGLAVQLDAVDTAWDVAPDDARNLLIKAIAQTRSGLTETRRALQALRASPLEDLGLALALKTLAQGYAQRAAWQLALELTEELDSLPPDLEQVVYRIASEALTNILKHAAATGVKLTLQWQGNDLLLHITDDGIGFVPVGSVTDRFGLTGMRERAATVGGTLTVESKVQEGTAVTLLVPNVRIGLPEIKPSAKE